MIIDMKIEFQQPFYTTHSNYDWLATFGSDVFRPSLTRQDGRMSIKDIMNRFVRNQAVPSRPYPIVETDMDLSAYQNMDRFDKMRAQQELERRTTLLRRNIEEHKIADARVKAQADYDKRVAADVAAELAKRGGDFDAKA